MTEYEIADLAISKSMELQGMGTVLLNQIQSSGDIIQQFMTVLFAYLIAAHLIGASLSKIQVIIFTTLYTLWQFWTLALFAVRGIGIGVTLDSISALEQSRGGGTPNSYMPSSMVIIIQITLLAAALAASLYFMWEVRRSKKLRPR